MIELSGTTKLTYLFPAALPETVAYYANLPRTLSMLRHISIVHQFGEGQFRMLYSTVELGLYRVRLYCDLEAAFEDGGRLLSIRPLDGFPPVQSEASLYALTAQGFYSSQSLFSENGDGTHVEFSLQLRAHLPVPFGIRLMPEGILNYIADNISQRRMQEIAQGFIQASIKTYLAQEAACLTVE